MALDGRVVVVTGASRGVGAVLAQVFAEQNARLGLLARNGEALTELAESLPAEAIAVPCDVSDEAAVDAGFKQIAEHFGGVDSVVVNAGIAPPSHKAHKLDAETWRRVLDVNLTGAFLTAHAAHDHLAASGRGRLVLTSSIMAAQPRRGLSAYVASKAGIEGLARALAADWAADGICVNAVAPGFFDTGLGTAFLESDRLSEQIRSRTSFGRFGAAPELAAAISFLAGDEASYVTGQVIPVNGGYGLT
ncbi:SDR family NAD(P)-dependent oxidoreductase [Amycolatopsis sp.]|uniref:SDR family NAD(P)-dependent oxidoreductase n=1 Tax=Amycolatopsis sp. TaxID=37632 RepID=UPI002CF26295|nr:SDR family NAD(P)-dependent oxidoreductase [Amycolatopsis sp.]HVV14399.1 SDR family NAD(P)-dependent oxidoreductase [Amycolatopsis sp.]